MAAKKKKKAPATKKKTAAPAKKKKKKTVPATTKKAAPATKKKHAPATKKKAAPAGSSRARAAAVSHVMVPSLSHHPVSLRQMDQIAHDGLRGDGEILHVEENEFAPCRLVDHGEARFSLCFDDFRMPAVPLFAERGLQGGGYTWEAVAQSLVTMRRPDITPDLSYDSEAGMFVALGGRESLRIVAKLIQEAIREPQLLQQALERADPDALE